MTVERGEAYFIPLEPEAFFAERDLGEGLKAPESGPGLRFEARCMSCGVATEETTVLRGGVRSPTGGEGMAWEQPVPMCASCQALGERRARVERLVGQGALVLAATAAGGASLLAVALGWSKVGGFFAFIVTLLAAFVAVRAAAARWLEPWLLSRLKVGDRALSEYRAVELYYFRDPRQGEEARFLCLRIEDAARAEAFGRNNPHAIPSEVWDRSLEPKR